MMSTTQTLRDRAMSQIERSTRSCDEQDTIVHTATCCFLTSDARYNGRLYGKGKFKEGPKSYDQLKKDTQEQARRMRTTDRLLADLAEVCVCLPFK